VTNVKKKEREKMYEQKTILCESLEDLDKKANKAFDEGYLYVGPPVAVRCNGDVEYMQTVVMLKDNRP